LSGSVTAGARSAVQQPSSPAAQLPQDYLIVVQYGQKYLNFR